MMAPQIAAIFVQKGGSYYGLEGVDPWDQERDARKYAGPHPVVAHPPCQRWGKMWAGSPSVIAKTGVRKIKGDDDGCFAAALDAVRRYGGVLEHPWGSHAWPHFNLNKPPREGGWVAAELPGLRNYGWTCCVEQGRYGHYCPKPTMLYAVGCDLPELEWGVRKVKRDDFPEWALEKYGEAKCRRIGLMSFQGGGTDSSPRIHTPEPFRDILLDMARSAHKNGTKTKRDSAKGTDMPKYRLKANCGWIANSETDFGVEEFDTLEEAQQAAFDAAAERSDTWAEEVTDEDE